MYSPHLPGRLNFFLAILLLLSACKKADPSSAGQGNLQPAITTAGTPVGTPVTKTIGASGGSLVSPDGKLTLTIPAGALGTDLAISIQLITNQAPGGIGLAYDLLPNGTKFTIPTSLSYHYTADDADGTSPDFMYIVTQDSTGAWSFDPARAQSDTIAGTIGASISHFSSYALISSLQMNFGQKAFRKSQSNFISVNQMTPFDQSGRLAIAASVQVADPDVNNWSLNDQGKTTIYGTISGEGGKVTFVAPAKIDKEQSVKVAAEITGPFTAYANGQKITLDKFTLADHLTLVPDSLKVPDSLSFYVTLLAEIHNTSGVYNDKYRDATILQINVVNGVVSFPADSILNFTPNVFPPSGSNALYTAVWIPDSIGLINVTGEFGFVFADTVTVFLTHTGTVLPKWQTTSFGVTTTFGGDPTPGWPPSFLFSIRDTAVQYPINIYDPQSGNLLQVLVEPKLPE